MSYEKLADFEFANKLSMVNDQLSFVIRLEVGVTDWGRPSGMGGVWASPDGYPVGSITPTLEGEANFFKPRQTCYGSTGSEMMNVVPPEFVWTVISPLCS